MFKDYINPDGSFKSDFFNEDYFEKGRETGRGWLSNYHWMPQRSFREAFAFIDYLGLDYTDYILEVGTAKGFLVRALRTLEINADGCDISSYALSFAPEGCWNCTEEISWDEHADFGYSHILIKDMLEHLTYKQLPKMLNNFSKVADKLTCVIPMGDNKLYRIPEYHIEISHTIIENEVWWVGAFKKEGWELVKDCSHIPGLKDNWFYVPNGNHIFSLERHV